jgi:hypothetical protein
MMSAWTLRPSWNLAAGAPLAAKVKTAQRSTVLGMLLANKELARFILATAAMNWTLITTHVYRLNLYPF